jgi:hypothetical protein
LSLAVSRVNGGKGGLSEVMAFSDLIHVG